MATPSPQTTQRIPSSDPPAEAGSGTLMKVCGIREPDELTLLARQQVDFVGLWYAVPGGPHDLPLGDWRRLAQAAADIRRLAPVLVTFTKDAATLGEALEGTAVQWIQLHGYPTPGAVRKVKAIGDQLRVIKVLHIRRGECVEQSLLGSYEKAGVDVFLFDAVSEDGRVGSTGQTLDPDVVLPLAEQISRPFLLAGGISESNHGDYAAVAAHPRFLGIDVDTNARDEDGRIRSENVAAISQAWKGDHHA